MSKGESLAYNIGVEVMKTALGDRKGYRQVWDSIEGEDSRKEIFKHVGVAALSALVEAGYTLNETQATGKEKDKAKPHVKKGPLSLNKAVEKEERLAWDFLVHKYS